MEQMLLFSPKEDPTKVADKIVRPPAEFDWRNARTIKRDTLSALREFHRRIERAAR